MKVSYIKCEDSIKVIVYILEEEKNDTEIMKKIDEYKEKYGPIAIFVSGSSNIEEILDNIVNSK